MKKGTLVFEYLRGNLYAFHLVVKTKDNKFKRLEFLKKNNHVQIFTKDLNYFDEWERNGFKYKYINRE